MKISPQVVAELAALTATLDDPDIDLLRSLRGFVHEVELAVPSYLGVSVAMATPDSRISFVLMEDPAGFADEAGIRSSLMIPASAALDAEPGSPAVTLIVYASVPGALVDLAADLSWLTGVAVRDFVLDRHLDGPEPTSSTLETNSLINQALGVLIGRGRTPQQAEAEIDRRAAAGAVSRRSVAVAILADLETRPPPVARGTAQA